jgi:hypothetical protein
MPEMRSAPGAGSGLQGGQDDTAVSADRGTSLNRDISVMWLRTMSRLAEADAAATESEDIVAAPAM